LIRPQKKQKGGSRKGKKGTKGRKKKAKQKTQPLFSPLTFNRTQLVNVEKEEKNLKGRARGGGEGKGSRGFLSSFYLSLSDDETRKGKTSESERKVGNTIPYNTERRKEASMNSSDPSLILILGKTRKKKREPKGERKGKGKKKER